MRLVFINKSSLGFLSALLILVFGLVLFTTNSCTHEGIPADQMEEVCFTQQVLPVFQNSCATSGCHDAATAEDGYIFTDYANIIKSIEPGNASKSKAYQAITSHSEMMPPDRPLPIDKRVLIRVWIEQGAKETTCPTSASLQLREGREPTQQAYKNLNSDSSSTYQIAYALKTANSNKAVH